MRFDICCFFFSFSVCVLHVSLCAKSQSFLRSEDELRRIGSMEMQEPWSHTESHQIKRFHQTISFFRFRILKNSENTGEKKRQTWSFRFLTENSLFHVVSQVVSRMMVLFPARVTPNVLALEPISVPMRVEFARNHRGTESTGVKKVEWSSYVCFERWWLYANWIKLWSYCMKLCRFVYFVSSCIILYPIVLRSVSNCIGNSNNPGSCEDSLWQRLNTVC